MRLRRGVPGAGLARVRLPASSVEPAAVLVLDPPSRTETLAGSQSGTPATTGGQRDPSIGMGRPAGGPLLWARCRQGCLHLLAPAEVVALTTAGRGETLCGRALLAASLTLTDSCAAQLCQACLATAPGRSSDRDLAGAR